MRVSRAGVYLKPLLVQCVNAAIKNKKNPYFSFKYERIKKSGGHKRAIIAIARMMLACIYYMFLSKEAFNPKDSYYSKMPEALFQKHKAEYIRNVIKLLEKEGCVITFPTIPV